MTPQLASPIEKADERASREQDRHSHFAGFEACGRREAAGRPRWLAAVYPYAQEVFAALLFLDFAAFGISLWREHDGNIQRALFSTANQLIVAGVFLSMLLNGPEWMGDIINMFITITYIITAYYSAYSS